MCVCVGGHGHAAAWVYATVHIGGPENNFVAVGSLLPPAALALNSGC